MSNPSDLPSQVTLNLDGDTLTVDAPTTNEYGIAGITSSLGNAGGGGGVKPRQPKKTAGEINLQLDASQEASGVETAKVEDIPDQPTFDDPKYQQNRNKQNQIRQDYQRITNYGDHDLDVSDYNLDCLLYTSPSPRDRTRSRMPSSA